MEKETSKQNMIIRPPVIVVMGHIDHGKSTLLDYIRKTNVTEKEAGGITQHVSAYEVLYNEKKITFLDTPGHAAFSSMRECGVCAADIAILVVSAEDGVKAQTLEALRAIREAKIPFVVAINKIDKTKQSLSENDIYVEGYGGDVPYAAISAKTGDGINDLLDTVLLVADMEELLGDPKKNAQGIILEANINPKKGISTTLIIKDGTLKKKQFIVSGHVIAPIRIMENFLGKPIDEARFSSPTLVIGWNEMPPVGGLFYSFNTKKEAENILPSENDSIKTKHFFGESNAPTIIPLVIKTDVIGSLEAVKNELRKLLIEDVAFMLVEEGVGAISENDIKIGENVSDKALVIGFHVGIDKRAAHLMERGSAIVKTFDVIYDISAWLLEEAQKRKPKISIEETIGTAKILRVFNKTKNKQVLGGRVLKGKITVNATVKILRRDYELGRGKIIELQQSKMATKEISEENEFGVMIESKTDVAEGDIIETFSVVTQ